MVYGSVCGVPTAATAHGGPTTTLARYVQKMLSDPEYEVEKRISSFTKVFTPAQEKEFVEYLSTMEPRFFGLTYDELRQLVYQLAEKNKIQQSFKDGDEAGKDWLLSFMKRHPKLFKLLKQLSWILFVSPRYAPPSGHSG